MKLGLYITTLTEQSKKRSHGLFSKIFRTSLLILILGSTSAINECGFSEVFLGVTVLRNSEKSQIHNSIQVVENWFEALLLGKHFVKMLGYNTFEVTRVIAFLLKH